MRDARELETRGYRSERWLIGDREHDGEGALEEPAGARLAGRVHDVRCEDTQREVAPDDHVVREGLLLIAFGGDTAFRRITACVRSWTPG